MPSCSLIIVRLSSIPFYSHICPVLSYWSLLNWPLAYQLAAPLLPVLSSSVSDRRRDELAGCPFLFQLSLNLSNDTCFQRSLAQQLPDDPPEDRTKDDPPMAFLHGDKMDAPGFYSLQFFGTFNRDNIVKQAVEQGDGGFDPP